MDNFFVGYSRNAQPVGFGFGSLTNKGWEDTGHLTDKGRT